MALATAAPAHEQSRARYPDETGYVTRDGVRVFYEVYGSGEPTILLLPTWSIVHSRFWKAQIPYLARHFRVVTFDGRGNGRSDRPVGAEAYSTSEFADDALMVMDATATRRAALVALSSGALWATVLAADHPERVASVVYVGPAVTLVSSHPERDVSPFEDAVETDPEWAAAGALLGHDYLGFVEFFFARCFNEPHSTKQIEDCTGWALQTTPQTILDTILGTG
ncbi:MAG: alpha/beta hydrolase, partial [Solirubrobacterales bacterium]|nr:alpha/beta hydrolase [Solirubrobacterales bacterium]